MKVKELMATDAEVLDPESTIELAAQTMAETGIDSLPVLQGGRLVGILTDRDIVVRIVAEGLPGTTKVGAAMNTAAEHCLEDDDADEAAELMNEVRVRRLAVLDADGGFAGVVALSDLAARALEAVAAREARLAEAGAAALVEDELAAIEIYKQALQSVNTGEAGDALRRIENEHEEAVELLLGRLSKLGVAAPSVVGAAGAWAKNHEKLEDLPDAKTMIRLLKEGEEREVADYEEAMRQETLDAELRELIASRLLPKTRARVPALSRYLRAGPVA